MKRAAVAIGIDRTGGLPELHDAAAGAQRFATWARGQGMDPVLPITDENESVSLQAIKAAIKAIVATGTVEQLLVYFAGHGVNIRYGEYWLLSDAPADTQAAVNVAGSVTLARYCGIPHVVFISDACRTAAEGVQAQFVTGGEIFPNEGADDVEQAVDVFFACTLGRPAHEIKNPDVTAAEYEALYTSVLIASLSGEPEEVVDWSAEPAGFVRPRALKRHLYDEVSQRVAAAGLETRVIQIPDARITSDEDAWLASVQRAEVRPPGATRSPGGPPVPVPENPTDVSRTILDNALSGGAPSDLAAIAGIGTSRRRGFTEDRAARTDSYALLTHAAEPFGAMSHETECGFKIRGGLLSDAFSTTANIIEQGPTDDLTVELSGRGHGSVLLTTDRGAGIVLPALAGFLCSLTIQEGELVDVAYEPSANSDLWDMFEERAAEVRTLRAVAASATHGGVFRMEGEGALELARKMQYAKTIDPSLAIYAAYAYRDLGRRDLIRQMGGFMREALGAPLFDVALLTGALRDSTIDSTLPAIGFLPLLSQGWGLLDAHRVTMQERLRGLERHLLDSAWTMFDGEGAGMLRSALEEGIIT